MGGLLLTWQPLTPTPDPETEAQRPRGLEAMDPGALMESAVWGDTEWPGGTPLLCRWGQKPHQVLLVLGVSPG